MGLEHIRGDSRLLRSLTLAPLLLHRRVVLDALVAPLDPRGGEDLRRRPRRAAVVALDEILVLIGGAVENGDIRDPRVLAVGSHRVRVQTEKLLTTDHISHNREQYNTTCANVNP